MPLFHYGRFLLHSGQESTFKIDCDALSDEDLDALARMIRQLIGSFDRVEGIPRGGLRLARALERYTDKAMGILHFREAPRLVVDDVLTTGRSMEEARDHLLQENHTVPVIGAVLFARGPLPTWVRALWVLHPRLWEGTASPAVGER